MNFKFKIDNLIRKRAYKHYLLIFVVCIFVNTIAYYPALFQGYHLSGDIRPQIYLVPKFFDRDLFPNDPLTEFIFRGNPDGYKYLTAFLFLFFNLYTISLILPFLLSFIPAVFLYRIGNHLKGGLAGLIGSLTFLLFHPVSELGSGGTIRACTFVIITSYLFYLIRKDYLKSGIILALTIWFCPHLLGFCSVTYLCVLFINRKDLLNVLKNNRALKAKYLIIAVMIFFGPLLYWMKLSSLPEEVKLVKFEEFVNTPEIRAGNENFINSLKPNISYIFSFKFIIEQIFYIEDFNEKRVSEILLPMPFILLYYFFIKQSLRKKLILDTTQIFFISSIMLNIGFIYFVDSNLMNLQGVILWYLVYMSILLYICLKRDSITALPKEAWILFISSFISFILVLFLLPLNLKMFFHIANRRFAAVFPIFLILFTSVNFMFCYKKISGKKIVLTFVLSLFVFIFLVLHNYRNSITLYKCEEPKFYETIRSLPKGALIAGHPYLMDAVPLFGQRKVLVNSELSHISWHSKIWNTSLREKTYDVFDALYSYSRVQFLQFCEKYKSEDVYFVVNDYYYSDEYLNKQKLYFAQFHDYIKNITKHHDFYLMHIDDKVKLYNDGKIFIIRCNDFLGQEKGR